MDWKALGEWVLAILPVILPVAATLVALWLTNSHNRNLAEIARSEAREKLQAEISEHRYEDRRDAVIGFDAAAQNDTDKVLDYLDTHGSAPGDFHDEYTFPELNAALAKVTILATPPVVTAALEVKTEVLKLFNGTGEWPRYNDALAAYRAASQTMLATGTTAPHDPTPQLSTPR